MFANTLDIIAEANLTYLHVFPYSVREGTPAARMPQVAASIAKERAAILRAAGERQVAALCASRIGKIETVLTERNGIARTEQFLAVAMPGAQPGQLLAVRVTGVDQSLRLIVEPLAQAA